MSNTLLYRGQGVVSVAEVGFNYLPMGFVDLGNCPRLEIRTSTTEQRHEESRTGKGFTDALLESQQVTLSLTLDSVSANNLARYFYGRLVPEASRLVENEPIVLYRGMTGVLSYPGVVEWLGLRDRNGNLLIRRESSDPLVWLAFFDGAVFTVNNHGLTDGRLVKFFLDDIERVTINNDFVTINSQYIYIGDQSGYKVFNATEDTFQLRSGARVVTGTAGELIIQGIYDYQLDDRLGALTMPGSSRLLNGETVWARYRFASLDRLYGFFRPTRPVMLMFAGVNVDDRPVRVRVHRVKLGPCSAWGLIGNSFTSFEVEGLVLPDHRQQFVTIEFSSPVVFPPPPPPEPTGIGFVNAFLDALDDLDLPSVVFVNAEVYGYLALDDMDLLKLGFTNAEVTTDSNIQTLGFVNVDMTGIEA
jgi:hypothetical protein